MDRTIESDSGKTEKIKKSANSVDAPSPWPDRELREGRRTVTFPFVMDLAGDPGKRRLSYTYSNRSR